MERKENAMKKIEAIIRTGKVSDVYSALNIAGCPGLMISEVEGQGKQKGVIQKFRGKEYRTELLNKAKVEIIADDEDVEKLCDVICKSAFTGKEGDGRIFVSFVENTVQIRTGQGAKSIG
jgi:nitrogen regulatory protein P-II 1